MSSPTQRTLKWLRSQGLVAEVTERWNPHSRTRHDLFGMWDIVTLDQHGQLGGVQCCAGASHAARVTKVRAHQYFVPWMKRNGGAVISWSKRGPRGKRKTWQPRIEAL